MSPLHADAVSRLVARGGPSRDDVLREMDERAEREGYPTVGPEAGRTLALLTRLLDVWSVLDLGSGFGYSAYWISRTLPAEGSIALVERDADLLTDAREYFERGGDADRAEFEHGDAIDVGDRREGPFDLVLLDHDTCDYVRGFEAVRDAVSPGGVVVADNVLATPATDERLDADGLLATLEGDSGPNDRTRHVADYHEHVGDADGFETYVLPVGEGLAVSCRL